MRISRFWAFAFACLAGAGHAGARAVAPRLPQASFNQLSQPLPLPYDEHADARSEVTAALARARAGHKLLLIDMGGNWCGDCRVLAGTMALPDLGPFLRAHYDVVMVDVGRFSKNMDIAARFGAPRPTGVPAVLIVDPASNALIDSGHTAALADARSMSPQALADWLAQWAR